MTKIHYIKTEDAEWSECGSISKAFGNSFIGNPFTWLTTTDTKRVTCKRCLKRMEAQ